MSSKKKVFKISWVKLPFNKSLMKSMESLRTSKKKELLLMKLLTTPEKLSMFLPRTRLLLKLIELPEKMHSGRNKTSFMPKKKSKDSKERSLKLSSKLLTSRVHLSQPMLFQTVMIKKATGISMRT